MDEKLLYTIFTIVYRTIRARKGDFVIIRRGRDIETVVTAVGGVEGGFVNRLIGQTDNLKIHCAEVGREGECQFTIRVVALDGNYAGGTICWLIKPFFWM